MELYNQGSQHSAYFGVSCSICVDFSPVEFGCEEVEDAVSLLTVHISMLLPSPSPILLGLRSSTTRLQRNA